MSVELAVSETVTLSLPRSASSTPRTVTVWGVSQPVVVKSRVAGDTVAAPVSLDDTATCTAWVGSVASWTVKVALPSSARSRRCVLRVMPGGMMSVMAPVAVPRVLLANCGLDSLTVMVSIPLPSSVLSTMVGTRIVAVVMPAGMVIAVEPDGSV